MTDIKAVLVSDIDQARDIPGAIEFCENREAETIGLLFMCPCGCGREGCLPFSPDLSPSWQFDGNKSAPKLTPSILQVGGCKWHGWLTAGVFVSC